MSCRGINWQCDSRNACYALIGSRQKSWWHQHLLRAECIPKRGRVGRRTCKAEVLRGKFMVGRRRGLRSLAAAKKAACALARKRRD